MKLFRKRLRFLGKKGFSMIELICGIAILGVMGTAVSGALVISADSYQRGTSETEIQQEAQLVANQISDLMIDATADVTFNSNTLTIKQGTKTYTVEWDAVNETLKYTERDASEPGYLPDAQLMAEDVTYFNVNVDDFQKTGYASMDLTIAQESRSYPAKFTISARNKDVTSEVTAVAKITTETDLLLEPNMVYDFAPVTTVTGIVNTDVKWEFYEGFAPTDSFTTISEAGLLTIGNDETATLLRLKVSTRENDAAGNSLASKMVIVRVRRANEITLVGSCVSGEDLKAGAVYELTAVVSGKNFERHEMDSDADWNDRNGYAVSWTPSTAAYTLTPLAVDASNPSVRKATLQLHEDITVGNNLTITATAAHAAGLNKKGVSYASVTDDYVLQASIRNPGTPAGGMLRNSHEAQATWDATILNDMIYVEYADRAPVKWNHQFRYKKDAPGESWTEWQYTSISGWADGGGSTTTNIRGALSSLMELDYAYDIEVRVVLLDAAGNIVWPSETSVAEQTASKIGGHMKKFGVTFDSTYLGIEDVTTNSGASPEITVTKGQLYEDFLTYNQFVGYDTVGTSIENKLRYKVEKLVDGSWVSMSTSQVWTQDDSPSCKIKFETDDYAGDYRIKVWISEIDTYGIDSNGDAVSTGKTTHELYDATCADGVFYFTAK